MAEQDFDWTVDVIAVWKREKDGMELHLRRNGDAFFVLSSGKTEEAVKGTCFDRIEEWRKSGEGRGFKRIDLTNEPRRKES